MPFGTLRIAKPLYGIKQTNIPTIDTGIDKIQTHLKIREITANNFEKVSGILEIQTYAIPFRQNNKFRKNSGRFNQ